MKKLLTVTLLLFCLSGIACIFWYSDWKFSLPTPVPANYHPITPGTYVDLAGKLPLPSNKPVFLHFFNPDCPCSRFNIPQFKSLVRKYGDKLSFGIVVLNNQSYTEKQIQEKFDADIPVLFDSTLAAACGVYSTPQAVLLDEHRYLYYRGNYNKNRYCADTRTNFAQMAIDSLLGRVTRPLFPGIALRAYGCELPICTQN